MELGDYWSRYGELILEFGLSVPSIYSSGVGSNTYRTLHLNDKKNKGQIQILLNQWSNEYRHRLNIRNDYSELHSELVCLFKEFSQNNLVDLLNPNGVNQVRSYAFPRKIVDLFVKQQAYHGHLDGDDDHQLRNWLLRNAFQPLDKHSLNYLRVACDLTDIPKNVGMGYVKSDEQYCYFQNLITTICNNQKVPKFAFDYYVWNYSVWNPA
jgi:hypothetical protein